MFKLIRNLAENWGIGLEKIEKIWLTRRFGVVSQGVRAQGADACKTIHHATVSRLYFNKLGSGCGWGATAADASAVEVDGGSVQCRQAFGFRTL